MNDGDKNTQKHDDTDAIDDLLKRAMWVQSQIESHLLERIDVALPDLYVRVLSRIKTKRSIRRKIQARHANGNATYSLQDITDVVGFRIVCHFQSDTQKITRLLLEINKQGQVLAGLQEAPRLYTTLSPNQPKLIEAMRSLFHEFGYNLNDDHKASQYTSLHIVCKTGREDFPPIEFQVRNVFEDAWASIEHATKYKDANVSATVSRHLGVLNTLIQGCVEYAEAIRAEHFGDSQEDVEAIKPIIQYPGDLSKLSKTAQELMLALYDLRKADKHLEIIEKIQKFREICPNELRNDELAYVLDMEKALSLLKLNQIGNAQVIYESIADRYPDSPMVHFRLSELHQLRGDYELGLAAIQHSEKLLGNGNDGDRKWIERHLPLKKAYLLWLYKSADEAYVAVSAALAKLPQYDELQRTYFNSVVYYALESKNKPDIGTLHGYLERMKAEKMASTADAAPEYVETYAWLALHAGEVKEAVRAMQEVMRCIKPLEGASWFEHKSQRWLITPHVMGVLLQHATEIFGKLSPP